MLFLAGCSSSAPDDAAVRACFETYRRAIVSRDGAAALGTVDAGTIAYFEGLRRGAVELGEAELRALPVIDRLETLLTRVRVPRHELAAMSGAELLRVTVENGWIPPQTVQGLTLERVELEGDTARAKLRQGVTSFVFHREEGSWRIDLVYLKKLANRHIRTQIQRSGLTEREFIDRILAETLGVEQLPPELWQQP